jgi:hypothetical protein
MCGRSARRWPPGANYRIRIVSTKAAGTADVSDATFRIAF